MHCICLIKVFLQLGYRRFSSDKTAIKSLVGTFFTTIIGGQILHLGIQIPLVGHDLLDPLLQHLDAAIRPLLLLVHCSISLPVSLFFEFCHCLVV